MGIPTMKQVIAEISKESLTGCGFKLGDRVTFTNEYGVAFEGNRIIGFGLPAYKGGGTVYLDKDAYWFPVSPESLKLEYRKKDL